VCETGFITVWHAMHEFPPSAAGLTFWWHTKQVASGFEAASWWWMRKLSVWLAGFTLRVWLTGVNNPATVSA
jgi:hypothetical protein